MYLVLVLSVRRRANPIGELYADALGSALERVVRDFERRYIRRKREAPGVDVEQQVAQVRAAVAVSGLPARTDVLSPEEARRSCGGWTAACTIDSRTVLSAATTRARV